MFYKIYKQLCEKNGESVTSVARKLNLAPNLPAQWAAGSEPRNSTKKKIAEYFGVDVSVFDETGHTTASISPINTPRADELVLLSQYRELTAENKIKTIEYMEFLLTRQAVNKKTAN